MAGFSTELSGSVVFNSGSLTQAALVPSLNALALTGSFNITGSKLTFNGVDVMNEINALKAGGTNTASILPLNAHSASINNFTSSQVTINQNNVVDSASFDNRIDTLEFNYNTIDTKVTNLENQNYISSSGQISAFGFITSSNSNLYSSSAQLLDAGFVTSSTVDIPAGTISSSAQIEVLGYITSSEYSTYAQTASYISVDNIDGIVNSSISSSFAATASYIDPNFISASAAAAGFGQDDTVIPAGTISSSAQITDLGFITSSTEFDIQAIGRINAYTASTNPRIDALEAFSSSLDADFATDAELSSLSQSAHIARLNITASAVDTGSINARLASLEAVTGSFTTGSHTSITALNNFTASYSTDSASFDSRLNNVSIDTSSLATDTELTALSASAHIARLNITASGGDVTGLLTTSSYQIDSASFDSRISDLTETGSIIAPVAFAVVKSTATGSGTNLSWGNWNSGNASLDFTFGTAQPNADYVVVTDCEVFDDNFVQITNKTTSGFVAGFYSDSSDLTPSDFRKFTFVVYGANPTQTVLISGSAGATDISALNAFTASYSLDSASFDSRILNITGSGDVNYDGNRIISSQYLPDLFSASFNPGTTGTVQDFLDAIFYPNTGPTFTSTGSFFVEEFINSGYSLGTLTATDPEGQSISFATASSYTDGFISVASNGAVTLATQSNADNFNTVDRGDGVQAHEAIVQATDTFGTSVTSSLYIVVNPNSAPVFRQTSTAGSIITSYTVNRNENASAGYIGRIYYSDIDGDAITIDSSSHSSGHFSLTNYGTYVQIDQVTSSLDYEDITSYNMSLTATDEHYQAGEDLQASASIDITINVTDNIKPVVNDQTLGTINENSANGTSLGTIAASDNENDTITFRNFTLFRTELDGTWLTLGTYGGTSQLTDPHEDPFQMSSAGQVTRKNGVYLNSDLINRYVYSVEVVDSYNTASDAGYITINISDDTPASISDNWSAGPYIIESAESGATIKRTSDGRTGTAADYSTNQSGTWSSSNSAININSNGTLSLASDLSGSTTQSGDVISSTITFTNSFGTTTTDNINVSVVENFAPIASFTNNSSIYNTNQATPGSHISVLSISDNESDTPYSISLSGTNASKLLAIPQNANTSSVVLQAAEHLTAGTYAYDITVTDQYSKSTSYNNRAFTIAQADNGTLGGDTTSYIIESAVNGDTIRDASGYNSGNASRLTVSYNPNYGSAAVQSFTSSNSDINIDNSGYITLGADISGSSYSAGDTIISNITFQDQYGNVGSGSLSVIVFANNAPVASFTNNSTFFNENQATGSTSLVDVSISDTEGDTPFNLSIGGANGSSFNAVPQNANSSSWEIQPSSDLSPGTYNYDVTVTDSFSKSNTYSRSLTINAADDGSLITNGTFYIIESALNGAAVRTNSNGRTGTQGSLAVTYSPNYGGQNATNFASSNNLIAIDSNGRLSAGANISGSGNTDGSLLATTITWNDQYGNNGSSAIGVNVTENFAPEVSGVSTSNLNTNQARGTAQVLQLYVTEDEGDNIPNDALSFTNYNSTYFTPSINTPYLRLNVNNIDVPAGTYPYTASIADTHGFSTNTYSGSFTVVQSGTGTLIGDTSVYAIESAEAGAALKDATGFGNGNNAQLFVNYSPNYGGQSVQSYTSSNAAIAVDNSGYLTLGTTLSGSATQSGDTVQSTITFQDQYGNIGSGNVTLSVYGNSSPSANFTAVTGLETDTATGVTTVGSLTVTDVENNGPFSINLSGTDGDKLQVTNSSSPYSIQSTGSLDAGTYSLDITVTDSYGEAVTLTNEQFTVAQSADTGKIYVYDVGQNTTNYNNDIGIQSVGSGTPASVSSYTGYGFLEKIEDGNLGDSSFTYSWGSTFTAYLLESGSNGNTLAEVLDNMDTIPRTNSNRFVILAPSGSDLGGVPRTMTDSYGGSTVDQYVLEAATDGAALGSGLGTTEASNVHKVTLGSAHLGYTDWIMIGPQNTIAGSSTILLDVRPSSGSAP